MIYLFTSDYTKDHAVLGELFATISCLAVRNEYCQEIVDQGGLKLVSAVMKENIDSAVRARICI